MLYNTHGASIFSKKMILYVCNYVKFSLIMPMFFLFSLKFGIL